MAFLMTLTFSLVIATASPSQSATQARPAAMFEVIETIERAYYRRDVATAKDALAGLETGDSYIRAWAKWRLANMYPVHGVTRSVKRTNEARRKLLLEDAEVLLTAYLEGSPDDVAATLVLSQVYQSRITGMMSGMRYGRRAGETLERALELDPDNPHALYHKGINKLMAPGPFGDTEEGSLRLREAVLRFEAELSGGGFLWGYGEALAFLGLALAKEGDMAGAREHYERALTWEPGYVWVRDELLTELP